MVKYCLISELESQWQGKKLVRQESNFQSYKVKLFFTSISTDTGGLGAGVGQYSTSTLSAKI